MESNRDALERLDETIRGPARELADCVVQLCGTNLAALVFYGPVARGGFDPKRHRARSVLVLKRDDLTLVRALAREGRRFGRAGLLAPLMMTPAYIQASRDTFPLELIEIQQQHVTVLGDDPFAELTFEPAHVRLQCEREFKTLLIGMRQGVLSAAGRDTLLGEVAGGVVENLLRILRGLLWLKGQKEVGSSQEVLARVEAAIARPLPGVRPVLTGGPGRDWASFQQLYEDIRHLGDVADAL